MDKQSFKKLKTVLIAFVILIIPLSYVLFVVVKTDEVYTIYQNEYRFGTKKDNKEMLEKIDFALSLNPWNKSLLGMKVNLLMNNKQYHLALDYTKDIEAYETTALLYEYLNDEDSAKIYYKKEILRLENMLDNYKDEPTIFRSMERQLALLYTFIGDDANVIKYMKEMPVDIDYYDKINLQRIDFYIENYAGGGYKDYLEGERLVFGTDHISNSIDIDSLITANRFFYDGETCVGEKCTYKIRKIFEQKALKCGLNKIPSE